MALLEIILIIFLSGSVQPKPGQWTDTITVSSNQEKYYSYDYGINLTNSRSQYMFLKACPTAIISLSEDRGFNINTVKFAVGITRGRQFVAIHFNCSVCYSNYIYTDFSECGKFMAVWVRWSDSGEYAIGKGEDSSDTTTEVLKYTSTVPTFAIKYFYITTFGSYVAEWILVKDERPECRTPNPDGSTILHVTNDSPINTHLLTMDYIDPENDNVTASVIGANSNTFSISGNILSNQRPFNTNKNESFKVEILLSDGRHETKCSLIVMATGSPPEGRLVVGDVREVDETVLPGTIIDGLFRAEGPLTNYSLSGKYLREHSQYFTINTTSGEIRSTLFLDVDEDGDEPITPVQLDNLTVHAHSYNSGHQTVDLNITIVNMNDNPPYCQPEEYHIDVKDDFTGEMLLTTMTCHDKDGDDITLQVSSSSQLDGFLFLHNRSLHLNVKVGDLQGLSPDLYRLEINANDNPLDSFQQFSTSFNVFLQIKQTNRFPPVFVSPPFTNGSFLDLTIAREISINTELTTIQATDADHHGNVVYSLQSVLSDDGVDYSTTFVLRPNGSVVLNMPLGGEEVAYFDLVVVAEDDGVEDERRSTIGNLRIVIATTDVEFNQHSSTFFIPCTTGAGDVLPSPFRPSDQPSSPSNESSSHQFANFSPSAVYTEVDSDGYIKVSTNGVVRLVDKPETVVRENLYYIIVNITDRKSSVSVVQWFLIFGFHVCSPSTQVTDYTMTTESTSSQVPNVTMTTESDVTMTTDSPSSQVSDVSNETDTRSTYITGVTMTTEVQSMSPSGVTEGSESASIESVSGETVSTEPVTTLGQHDTTTTTLDSSTVTMETTSSFQDKTTVTMDNTSDARDNTTTAVLELSNTTEDITMDTDSSTVTIATDTTNPFSNTTKTMTTMTTVSVSRGKTEGDPEVFTSTDNSTYRHVTSGFTESSHRSAESTESVTMETMNSIFFTTDVSGLTETRGEKSGVKLCKREGREDDGDDEDEDEDDDEVVLQTVCIVEGVILALSVTALVCYRKLPQRLAKKKMETMTTKNKSPGDNKVHPNPETKRRRFQKISVSMNVETGVEEETISSEP